MRLWRRSAIIETLTVILILLGSLYFMEGRFPNWRERKKMSQRISASYDNADLKVVLQSMVDQTDGTVSITLCDGLTNAKVSLHTQGSVPLSQALKEIATQIPDKYYPYGMLDVAVAHPLFVCEGRNGTTVTLKKTALEK
jgi:hypothetical protein